MTVWESINLFTYKLVERSAKRVATPMTGYTLTTSAQ